MFFCVFNLLGAQKTFLHRQSVWIQIGVDGILMGSHELIGDGSGKHKPRYKTLLMKKCFFWSLTH